VVACNKLYIVMTVFSVVPIDRVIDPLTFNDTNTSEGQ
jgi:hypothetical protein